MKNNKKSVISLSIITPLILILIVVGIMDVSKNEKNSTVLLKPNTKNTLSVGEIGSIVLKGNVSTGFSWNYKIEDTDVLTVDSTKEVPDSKSNIVGSGNTYTWNIKALKTGQTKITFKYYRGWLDESTADPKDVIEYIIDVKQ